VDELTGLLGSMGLPARDLYDLPDSTKRFPDGAQCRVEIPSTEGPECLDVVLSEAARLEVPVHRVSQGSGVLLTTDRELDELAGRSADAGVEVSLFARPNAAWESSTMTLTEAGRVMSPAARGQDQLRDCLADVLRAADHGFRSVLIADLGVLSVFGRMRAQGLLPSTMRAKVSVMLPAANPATARVLADLGANTLNLPTDLDLPHIAAIRAAVDLPLDIYVEAPANLGGRIMLPRIPDLVRIAAPVYLKFGLRNGPDVYPAGRHLRGTILEMSRERVRRARLGLEILERSGINATMSAVGAADLAIAQPVANP
jgi:hypothetical protein